MANKVIWKFPFDVADEFTVKMPPGAEILSVDTQRGHPCIWALVRPVQATDARRFAIRGTGHPFDPAGMSFVGTFLLAGGSFVGHLFERADGE